MGADLAEGSPGQLDLPRARRGGLGAVVFACWVDPRYCAPERGGAGARAHALLDALHGLVERHPERVSLVRDRRDLAEARDAGRLAALAGGHTASCYPVTQRESYVQVFGFHQVGKILDGTASPGRQSDSTTCWQQFPQYSIQNLVGSHVVVSMKW